MLKPFHTKNCVEAGCDEAGRGCLAGPVYAAAVILPKSIPGSLSELLKDSKKLSPAKRKTITETIKQEALCWAVAAVDNNEIDRINILNASMLAMHKALDKLAIKPGRIIVDGNRFKSYNDIPHTCIVKGDNTFMSIAAASIIAKTYRDKHMMLLHNKFPQYNWNNNKGYATKHHRGMVLLHGLSPYHRRTFKINEQLKLSL